MKCEVLEVSTRSWYGIQNYEQPAYHRFTQLSAIAQFLQILAAFPPCNLAIAFKSIGRETLENQPREAAHLKGQLCIVVGDYMTHWVLYLVFFDEMAIGYLSSAHER